HFSLSFLFLLIPLPPTSTLFPYTTLFRSINWFATTPYLFNDGTNVFSISNYCCAGVENALYGYYVSDGTWKFTDLLTPQNVSSFFYAARSLVISFDNGRFVRWYAPESLMTTKNY